MGIPSAGIASEVGHRPIATARSFQDAIAQTSRSLNACQEIANGSKHRVVRREEADPHVRAGLQWAEIAPLPTDPPGGRRYRLMWAISDRIGARPALEVFNEAADYWADFPHRRLLFRHVATRASRASSA